MKRLVTVDQWAEEAKCSRMSVYSRIKAGTMESTTTKSTGSLILIDCAKYPPSEFSPKRGRVKIREVLVNESGD